MKFRNTSGGRISIGVAGYLCGLLGLMAEMSSGSGTTGLLAVGVLAAVAVAIVALGTSIGEYWAHGVALIIGLPPALGVYFFLAYRAIGAGQWVAIPAFLAAAALLGRAVIGGRELRSAPVPANANAE